jgi:prolipoprotein diacylglyceryl transferase
MRSYIPTPSVSALTVGPVTIHFYALCIIIGIIVAISVLRFRAPDEVDLITEVATFAIPGGIIGARLYHVITTPEKYFNSNYLDAFKVWQGGLGIWGAISGGALAAYWALRKNNATSKFLKIADALAPGLLFAQAIGRFGNWFNGELFGGPTKLPWALEIPVPNRPENLASYSTFHPTFLYEALWCTLIAIFLMRYQNFKEGQVFWVYVALYSIGRMFIEMLRTDYSNLIFGIRLNVFVAGICLILAAWQFLKIKSKKIG